MPFCCLESVLKLAIDHFLVKTVTQMPSIANRACGALLSDGSLTNDWRDPVYSTITAITCID